MTKIILDKNDWERIQELLKKRGGLMHDYLCNDKGEHRMACPDNKDKCDCGVDEALAIKPLAEPEDKKAPNGYFMPLEEEIKCPKPEKCEHDFSEHEWKGEYGYTLKSHYPDCIYCGRKPQDRKEPEEIAEEIIRKFPALFECNGKHEETLKSCPASRMIKEIASALRAERKGPR